MSLIMKHLPCHLDMVVNFQDIEVEKVEYHWWYIRFYIKDISNPEISIHWYVEKTVWSLAARNLTPAAVVLFTVVSTYWFYQKVQTSNHSCEEKITIFWYCPNEGLLKFHKLLF